MEILKRFCFVILIPILLIGIFTLSVIWFAGYLLIIPAAFLDVVSIPIYLIIFILTGESKFGFFLNKAEEVQDYLTDSEL